MAILKIKELSGETVTVDCGTDYPQTFKVDEDYEEPTIISGDDRIFRDSFGVYYSVDFNDRHNPFYDLDHMPYYTPSSYFLPDMIEFKFGESLKEKALEAIRSTNIICGLNDIYQDYKGNVRYKHGEALYFQTCQVCGKPYSDYVSKIMMSSRPICDDCLSQDDLVIEIKEVCA